VSFWSSFWNVVWLFVWSLAFIAYLFAFFAVIVDLFRDRTVNAWRKALWIVGLVAVPFASVVVYVVTRGEGMALRSDWNQRATPPSAEDSRGA